MAVECSKGQSNNFCGRDLVHHSMCLLPALPCNANLKLSGAKGRIKFIDCGLIIIFGSYTQTVFYDEKEIMCEDVPFQVLIEDSRITNLNKESYIIEYIELKEVCRNFTCLDCEANKYHKLEESVLVSIRVSYNQCNSISWTQDVYLY